MRLKAPLGAGDTPVKDVKTKERWVHWEEGLMHTAQGLGTIAAMRPRLSWVQSAQTLVGPARAPVLRKNKPRVVKKTKTHPCAHNAFLTSSKKKVSACQQQQS